MIKAGLLHGLLGLYALGCGTTVHAASISFAGTAQSVQQAQFDDVMYQPNIATPFSVGKPTYVQHVTFRPVAINGNTMTSGRLRIAVYRNRGNRPAEQVAWLRNFSTRCIAAGVDLNGTGVETFVGEFDSILLGEGNYWFALVGPSGESAKPDDAPIIAAPDTIPFGTGFNANSNWYSGGSRPVVAAAASSGSAPPVTGGGGGDISTESSPPPNVAPVPLPWAGFALLSGLVALGLNAKRAPKGARV